MKLQSDARSKAGPRGIALPDVRYAPDRRLSQHTRRLLMRSTVRVMLLLLVGAVGYPAFSQGVQLVRVDVQVVENGYRVSKLTGHTVVNDKNERIGKIDDFVIGHDEGRSLFTVLQVGGFLGIGSHLVAVPYDALTIDDKSNKIELPGASKDQLKQLAEFQYGS
jgi:sporulation protein YlmC with PRC-barrel domain